MLQYFSNFKNYLFGSNASTNSSCPSSPAQWCFDDIEGYEFCIQNPSLIPTCILALTIGLYCSNYISKLSGKFPTRWLYQLTFFLFGIMMTSAGILHCFLNVSKNSSSFLEKNDFDTLSFLQLLVAVIDVGLTTNIAVSFSFCGLCDIKILNPNSNFTRFLLLISYFIVFLLWTLGILNNWSWTFHVLYLGVISVCCFIYVITQLFIKSNRRALPTLFFGGVYGAIGLYVTSIGAERVCKSEGPFWSQYIGPQFLWFLFSDISVAFVFLYVVQANRAPKAVVKKCAIDIEKNPEKF